MDLFPTAFEPFPPHLAPMPPGRLAALGALGAKADTRRSGER